MGYFFTFLLIFFHFSNLIADDSSTEFSLHPVGSIGSTPYVKNWTGKLFSYHPTGAPARANPIDCSARTLGMLVAGQNSAAKQGQVVQDFFNRCEKKLTLFAPTDIKGQLESLDTDYKLENRTNVFEVIIRMPNGPNELIKLRGLLALKPSLEKRPLVIAICGVECNIQDNFPKQLMMDLYDSSPFNVLVLPNITGSDFVKDNNRLDMGGFEEGRQTYQVIQFILDPLTPLHDGISLRDITSSVHIFGMSLGGHASLYASLYASSNYQFENQSENKSKNQGEKRFQHQFENGSPKIQSVISYCPVIDLKSSLDYLDRQNDFLGYGKFFRGSFWDLISSFQNLFPFPVEQPQHNDYVSLIGKIISPRYVQRTETPDYYLAPFHNEQVRTADDFWNKNNFLNYTSLVKVPTLVFGSEDDPVVHPSLNSEAIKSLLIKIPNENMSVAITAHGLHCATQLFYGWDIFTSLVQSFILNHSPEFDQKSRLRTIDLQTSKDLSNSMILAEGEKFFGHIWSIDKKTMSAVLTFNIFDPTLELTSQTRCMIWNSSKFGAGDQCFRHISFKLPIESILQRPVSLDSDIEVQVLTRWLNGRVFPLTKTGHDLVDSSDTPSYIEWAVD